MAILYCNPLLQSFTALIDDTLLSRDRALQLNDPSELFPDAVIASEAVAIVKVTGDRAPHSVFK